MIDVCARRTYDKIIWCRQVRAAFARIISRYGSRFRFGCWTSVVGCMHLYDLSRKVGLHTVRNLVLATFFASASATLLFLAVCSLLLFDPKSKISGICEMIIFHLGRASPAWFFLQGSLSTLSVTFETSQYWLVVYWVDFSIYKSQYCCCAGLMAWFRRLFLLCIRW